MECHLEIYSLNAQQIYERCHTHVATPCVYISDPTHVCLCAAARGTDSSAAGPALCAVHAAVLQPAASAAAVITAAATADVRVHSHPAEPVTSSC